MNQLPLKDTYIEELMDLYSEDNATSLSLLADLLVPNAKDIAKSFYRVMLQDKYTVTFLTNTLVEERLTASMINWVTDLFEPHSSKEEIEAIIDKQVQVGHVHARIDLPMSFVNFGMRTLKISMSGFINDSTLNQEQKANCLLLMNSLVDTMVSLINDSYVIDIVVNERDAQAFRLHVSSSNLAFDFERLRTSLLDWVRHVLSKLHDETVDVAKLPTIRHSDFGLWLTHKGALILIGRPELNVLMNFVTDANEIIEAILALKERNGESKAFRKLLHQLNEHVTKVVWILGNTAQEMLDIDSGRDSLTHLFNRRYLPTVLHHEIECGTKTGMRFGILYIDIDHFKQINDDYGHDNGDTVLQQFATVLSNSVRTGDFVFRYGGEEFLIVLADITQEQLPMIADKIRGLIEKKTFVLLNEDEITITASVGAAIHDGHPDYQHTITNADKALFEAKESGRNRIIVFEN